MRTMILIGGGLVLLAAIHIIMRNSETEPAGLFLMLWFAVTLLNLRGGLKQGYSLLEELPIQALVFGVPAFAALVVTRLFK